MLNNLFRGVFDTNSVGVISVGNFLLCVAVALLSGALIAFLYGHQARASHSFLATLAMLPAVVCVVIMMVNGNVGAGVAVAGAFSLVRFRSAPGTGQEIGALFLAMTAGLIAGMGYLAYALLFSVVLGCAGLALSHVPFSGGKKAQCRCSLRITVPEDLNYTDAFDDVFEDYLTRWELQQVKTTNMGSLFRLRYDIVLRDPAREKDMIDALRCLNGNLEIMISREETAHTEL